MTLRAWLCLLPLGFAATALRAETVYVVEQVVVSVASTPGGAGERVGQVKSADRLELLERQGQDARVRLPNGTEGWIRASYLSAQEPLQLRLDARTAELDRLKQETERLRQEASSLQTELTSARAAHGAPPAPAAGQAPSAATANTAQSVAPAVSDALSGGAAPIRETVFLREPDHPGRTPWRLLLGLSFSMLLVGFALGWLALDRRIRRRYGGLRIY